MKLANAIMTRSLASAMTLAVLLLAIAAGAQAAPPANHITVRDQNLDTGIIVVDSVTAAQSGWVVIYKAPDFTAQNLVGKAAVQAGTNLGVKVVVGLPVINHAPTLWAVLQADEGTPGIFEWGLSQRAYDDAPVSENGEVVMAKFQTSVPPPLPAFLETVSGGAPIENVPDDQITVHDQDVRSGVILVDAVTTTEPGWVVFYKNANFTPGEIVGFAPVYPGVNTNVKATIDTLKLGTSTGIWVQLHRDDGRQGVFEWAQQKQPLSDWPIIQHGSYVRASFSTTPAPLPTPAVAANAAQITVHDQSLGTGIAVLDSVVSPYNGWVVIYKNPNFTSGEIVGYAPVYNGTNRDVKVTIDTAKVGDQEMLWAVLHVDGGLQNIFEWGYNSRAFNDPPLFQNGQYVSAVFSTTGPQPKF